MLIVCKFDCDMGWTIIVVYTTNVIYLYLGNLNILQNQEDDTCRIHIDYGKEKHVEYQIIIDKLSRYHINYIQYYFIRYYKLYGWF